MRDSRETRLRVAVSAEGRGRGPDVASIPSGSMLSGPLPRPLVALALGVACAAAPLKAQCPDGTPPPCSRPAPPPPPPPTSVAVLYFRSVSGDTTAAVLADGLTDALITRLSQVQRLTIKSRTAVARYRGRADMDPAALGRALQVASLLSGTLQRVGSRYRITVELSRAATGVVLWSDQYLRAIDDLLGIEESVSRAVARGVVGRLLPQEQASLSSPVTRNGTAYEHFLKGNAYLAQRSPVAAIGALTEYEAAARLDTTFTEALARVAMTHEFFLDWGWTYRGLPAESLLAYGVQAADRALAMDPLSSDAWLARGLLLAKRSPLTYEGVLPALERAVALDSRNAEAWHQLGAILWQLGRDSASIAASVRALEIEPGRAITFFQLALASLTLRLSGTGRSWLDSAVAADPTFPYAYALRAYQRAADGDLHGAREDADNAIELGGRNRLPGEAALVGVLARTGDTAAARARLAPLTGFLVDSTRLTFREGLFAASAALAAGESDRALDYLERVRPRGAELWSGLRLPAFDPLRSNPRFQRLVEETRPSPR